MPVSHDSKGEGGSGWTNFEIQLCPSPQKQLAGLRIKNNNNEKVKKQANSTESDEQILTLL